MRIWDFWWLARREFLAFRMRSVAAVVTIGVMYGLLLAVLMLVQGLENIVMRYARAETDGIIYLASEYTEDNALVRERICKYGGEIVEDVLQVVTASFDDVVKANEYYERNDARELRYDVHRYQIEEVHGNQLMVYRYFRAINHNFVRPVAVVLFIVATLVSTFTLAHLVSQRAQAFALYRSMGASYGQVLEIYFYYLLEVCLLGVMIAIAVAFILDGILTVVGWESFVEQLSGYYPGVATFSPIVIGANWACVGVIGAMLGLAPVALLLCLDNFSVKKMMVRLKGE